MNASKILIVDDVLEMRTLLQSLVTKYGYTADSAASGNAALAKIDAQPDIRLILLDIGLEDMSGFDFITKIAPQRKQRDLKIIFVSGKRDQPNILRAIQLGGDDYIVKPIDPVILQNKISNALLGRYPKSAETEAAKITVSMVNSPIEIPLSVIELTPEGITLESPVAFKVGSDIELKVPQLQKAAGDSRPLKCKIIRADARGKMFLIVTKFVSLSDRMNKAVRAKTSKEGAGSG